jgi:hypothetical protein
MSRVLALVEGPTERNFGQRVLGPFLGSSNVFFCPRVVGKPGRKGGARSWEATRRDLVHLMRQEPASFFTTMFDLYGLPQSWPGRQEAREKGLVGSAAATLIQERVLEDVVSEVGSNFDPGRLIPYVQVHEYEALLFSDPAKLASVTGGEAHVAAHARRYESIVAECGGCERIDDGPQTAPSKRIVSVSPGYQKIPDGIVAAERVTIQAMRACCPHFNQWIERLLALAR